MIRNVIVGHLAHGVIFNIHEPLSQMTSSSLILTHHVLMFIIIIINLAPILIIPINFNGFILLLLLYNDKYHINKAILIRFIHTITIENENRICSNNRRNRKNNDAKLTTSFQ